MKTNRNPNGTFMKGTHWQEPKPYWDKEWLEEQYIVLQKSTGEIAEEFGCHRNTIMYFMKKHSIQTRTMSEVRSIKQWCLEGENNGMFGRTGENNPNWKGGITGLRQSIYSSYEWRKAKRAIWKRDKRTCQDCGLKYSESKIPFHIHHIIPFVSDQSIEIDNLILLCRNCHIERHRGGDLD